MGEQSTEIARWDVDPNEWPHTPPLVVWRALYEDDDNLVWRAGIGHVVNALDAALERLAAVEAERDRLAVAVERALGLTKAGAPRHPLYLRSDAQPVIYPPTSGGAQ